MRDEYIRATFALSKSDPTAWATFMEAFKAYAIEEIELMLATTPEALPLSIGSARRLKQMRDDFIRIEELMHKITKK